MKRYAYPDRFTLSLSFLERWERATAADLAAGRAWYPDARRECFRIAQANDLPYARACGIVAALSPRIQWGANLQAAREVAATGETRGQTPANALKAWQVWIGERPLSVLGGRKVRAFYRTLLGRATEAVIDTWMLQAAEWPSPHVPTARQYSILAGACADAAALAGVEVSTFQATVWIVERGSAT